MKAPITQAQAWAVIAESAGWDVATKLDQSQAERIKELEEECEVERLRLAACGVAALGYFDGCKDEYKSASLDDVLRLNKRCTDLRAQLAAIAATEPVLVVEKEPDYWSGGHFHEGSKSHIKSTKVWRLPIGTQLFIRPMPAQSSDWSRFHHVMKDHGLHPGRTDDDLIDILDDHLKSMPAQPADHEVRELVNRLTAIAKEFHGAQQLRERIANEIRPFTLVKPAQDVTELVELTDAQILTLWEETYVQRGWTGIEFARAIERAHGIGAKQ